MSSDFDSVRGLLDINERDLDEEFTRLPAYIARWGFLAAEAANDVASAKHNYEKVFATTREEIRADAMAKNLKYTVDQLDGRVTTTLKVIMARDAISEAEMRKAKAIAVCEGLRAKRDMLVQLGASQRAAKETDLWMKQNRTPDQPSYTRTRSNYDPGPQWPRNLDVSTPTNPTEDLNKR